MEVYTYRKDYAGSMNEKLYYITDNIIHCKAYLRLAVKDYENKICDISIIYDEKEIGNFKAKVHRNSMVKTTLSDDQILINITDQVNNIIDFVNNSNK